MVKFKDFSRPLSAFQGKFCFQGLFKTVLYIQVLFKSVRTLRNLYVLVVKKVSRLSTLILPIFFVRMMIMLSAYYICYLHVYSNAHQRFYLFKCTPEIFTRVSNNMNTDQTAPKGVA